MLGRAVVFRCVAAAGHCMRIHAFRGGGGGCARPPVRWRLWRAAQAPGTAHVSTQIVVATYGRNDMQDLRRLDACWWREREEEEEEEEAEEEAANATASAASAAAASACCKGREYNNYRTGKWFKRSTAAAAQANTGTRIYFFHVTLPPPAVGS